MGSIRKRKTAYLSGLLVSIKLLDVSQECSKLFIWEPTPEIHRCLRELKRMKKHNMIWHQIYRKHAGTNLAWRKNSFPSIRGVRPKTHVNTNSHHLIIQNRCHIKLQPIDNKNCLEQWPGKERPRGGELAADDRSLCGYHGVNAVCPSYRGFVGDVTPDVIFGEPAVEYVLGDAPEDVIFGVADGVRRGVMYGLIEDFWVTSLDPAITTMG